MTSQVYNLDGPKEFPFPYPVRAAAQLTVEIVPGNVVSPGDYEVVGVGPTSTQVTVRYPNAPTTGGLQLKISRYVAPERVTVIDDPSDITTVNLNAEFNNIYEALIDFEEFILNLVQQMLDDFQNDVLDPALAEITQLRDDAVAAKDAAEDAQQGAEQAEQGATAAWDAFQDRYWGAYPTDPSVSPVGNPPTAGDLYWNTTVNQWRAWDANQGAWVSVTSAVPTYYDRRNYVATEGQTTFDAQYDAGFVQVWVNGLLLPPSDYEASSGTEVVLDEGVAAGTEVTIVGLGAVVVGALDGNDAIVTTSTGTQLLPAALDNRVVHVPDITALRALAGVQDGQIAVIAGYDDDSQAIRSQRFYWASASTEADNGRTVFAVPGVATGRWKSGELTEDGTSKALNRARGFGSRDNPWGIKCVNILGDSISHGADSTDIPNASWVGIFRKMLQIEYGGTHYGFCSLLDDLGVGTGEYHSVTRSAGWVPQTQESASHTMNGRGYTASSPGETIDITVPTGEAMFAVWYSGEDTGILDVAVNGAPVGTIDTSVGPYGIARSPTFNIVDNGFGQCNITITLASGSATVCGVSYLDNEQTFQVNNFSDSGRRGRVVDEAVIQAACQGCQFLVWALGTNDDNFAAGSPEMAAFRQRMDWLVQYAVENDTKIYFLELNFRQYNDNPVRAEIRRAVSLIPSAELVSMPDLLKIGNRTAQLFELDSGGSGFLYDDPTHPSDIGHKIIAETLAQRCGLSVTSKRQAEMLHGKWVPINLTAGGFENTNSDSNRVSAYKQVGTDWLVRLWINTPSAKSGDTIATLPFASNVTRYVPGSYSGTVANDNEVQIQSGTTTTLLYREVAGTPPTYANEFVLSGRLHTLFGPYQ